MARQVGPKNVVGRDKLIEMIWEKLETRSLRFTAERRVGKPLRNEDIARTILDHMATVSEPQSIDQVWAVVKSYFQITDRNHIVAMLGALALDHYLDHDLDSNEKKRYRFRFPLIQRWWKLAQGL